MRCPIIAMLEAQASKIEMAVRSTFDARSGICLIESCSIFFHLQSTALLRWLSAPRILSLCLCPSHRS
jgi:hypothetical protein